MNIVRLQQKLLTAARGDRPSERVPYAFEQRVMAHLQAPARPDAWTWLARWLWRATGPCLAVLVLLGAATYYTRSTQSADTSLRSAFQNALYAGVDASAQTW